MKFMIIDNKVIENEEERCECAESCILHKQITPFHPIVVVNDSRCG